MRKFLIHLLGGKTKEEMLRSNLEMLSQGKLLTLIILRAEAERLYGNANWAHCMYRTITDMINEAIRR